MNTEELKQLIGLETKDYESIGALEFEDIICAKLSQFGKVERQVVVPNRGDGMRGRIDLVFTFKGERIPIEVDRKSVRQKSLFKVRSYNPRVPY